MPDGVHEVSRILGRLEEGLQQVVRMIDEDRRDTASHRVRTREQLDELKDKLNPLIVEVARVLPIVSQLEEEREARRIENSQREGEERGKKHVRAALYTILTMFGAALYYLVDWAIKIYSARGSLGPR